MEIFIATASILTITGAIWAFNNILRLGICPVCAGVSGTWLWILAGMYFGLLGSGAWLLVAAIAMGGSVVGIAYQAERKLVGGKLVLYKILFIPMGFVAVYHLLMGRLAVFFAALMALAFVAFLFLRVFAQRAQGNGASKTTEDLEEKMKNCC